MEDKPDFSTYQSPFTWRYGSEQMRQIFSEENKFKMWRRIWVELATAQHKLGLVTQKELSDLKKHQNDIDIKRILEIEKDTRHDVVAAIKEFAQKAKIGGGKIHLGATSMDIVDNTDALKAIQALHRVESLVKDLLRSFSIQIEKYISLPCMGYTHLQPAEPTTLGYRLSMYAQDLLIDLHFLNYLKSIYKAKGFKGAVGTQASYVKLFGLKNSEKMEEQVMNRLGISSTLIVGQTSPRKYDIFIANLLVSIAQSLYKFAFDLRVMQSAGFGELQEPFGKSQVGSSAMPFKKNPIKSEQICSLARLVNSLSQNSFENASLSLLERTLDDSANRRVYIPEMFLAIDEMLSSCTKIVDGMIVNEKNISKNLDKFGPFSATEEVLLEAVKQGGDRQVIHEQIRDISMQVWDDINLGQANKMLTLLSENKIIKKYLKFDTLITIMDPKTHIGTAVERTQKFLKLVKKEIK